MIHFEFDEGEYLKEIDPNNQIAVYHRKGKDWYVGYSIFVQDMLICYKDEDTEYAKDEYEQEEIYFNSFQQNEELLNEVYAYIKNVKIDLEIKSYISNEIDKDYEYRNSDLNFELLALIYEDISDFKNEILEQISWDLKTLKTNFIEVADKVIQERVKMHEDLTIEIGRLSWISKKTDCYVAEEKTKQYSHLAILKKLEKRYGYELTRTAVSSSSKTIEWAIKKDSEEYHFNIAEVIANDISGEVSLKDFLRNVFHALETRKLEKIEDSELYAKASKVFVSFKDSIVSGNCEFGTKAFANKHRINTNKIGGLRGDFLLGLENSSFTKRAVLSAINRIAS